MTISLPLENKTVLVTGSSRGIGRAIARCVHRDGANVIVHYGSNRAPALALKEELETGCYVVGADLNQPSEVLNLWQQSLAFDGKIDVLVNNAGVLLSSVLTDDEDWHQGWAKTMQVNLFAAADLCRYAILHFKQQGGGTIINMASRSSHRGDDKDHLVYGASKGGLLTLTKGIARSFAHERIYAYALAPGWVKTDMAGDHIAAVGEEAICAELPMREITPPEEIAEMVSFLASGRVRHATGCTIDITGADYVR